MAVRLLNTLLGQGYVKEYLKSSESKLYGQNGAQLKQYESPFPKCYTTFVRMTIYSDILH